VQALQPFRFSFTSANYLLLEKTLLPQNGVTRNTQLLMCSVWSKINNLDHAIQRSKNKIIFRSTEQILQIESTLSSSIQISLFFSTKSVSCCFWLCSIASCKTHTRHISCQPTLLPAHKKMCRLFPMSSRELKQEEYTSCCSL
jgi:hypothetical protein